MRFTSIRAKGFGPFREEVHVDFGNVPGVLCAVTGANGAGKSTLLELLVGGALFRDCPTRGALASLATSRDAYLEVGVVNGASHKLRHVVDAVSGKAEAVVMDAEGKPLTSSAKLREFDAWVAKHLASPEVVYTSTFAAQAAGGFLDMKPAERKHALLKLLGIERLEVLAEKARAHAKATREAIAVLDARIADEQARASDVATVQAEIDALHEERAELERVLVEARETVEELAVAEEAAKLARQDVAAHMARRNDLSKKLAEATRQKADLDTRIANNRGVLVRAEEIRNAQARTKQLDDLIALHTADVAKLRVEHATANGQLEAAEREEAALQNQIDNAKARAEVLRERLTERDVIAKAVVDLPGLRERMTAEDAAITEFEARLEEARFLATDTATRRIDGLRGGLLRIAGPATDERRAPADIACDTVYADDQIAHDAEDTPRRIEGARSALRAAQVQRDSTRLTLTYVERLAARANEMTAAASDLAAIEADVERLTKALGSQSSTADLDAAVTKLDAAIREHDHQTEIWTDERTSLSGLVGLAEKLAQAAARLAELEPQAAQVNETVVQLSADLDALGELPEDVTLPDVEGARARVEAIRSKMSGNEAALAVKTAQLTDAHHSLQRITALDAERLGQDAELADWTRLADDIGRDGVQNLLIDAAGPEVTEITNHLLHEAFGPRFTVRFDTVKRSADNKKDLEAFDVRVIDTVEGRDANGETYSGGERVILNEAISLALTTLGCRRSGMSGVTLIRDESGAALDEARAQHYVAMLRKAVDLIGAHQCLLVSHSRSVQDLCDARIEIGNRKVSVS